jgi:membrane-associated phospholipid phosphatase
MTDPPPTENAALPELETIPKPASLIETAIPISLVAAVLSLFLFFWIADSVAHEHTMAFDLSVRARVHELANPVLTQVMIVVSFLGQAGLIIVAIFSLIAFIRIGWRRAALWLVTTLAGATVLDLTLKYAFDRPRPVPYFVAPPVTPSFPSGHALFSACFYGVLAGLLTGRLRSFPLRLAIWSLAGLLIAAIGFSRIYLGVHYPTDVIAGYLTAALWVSTMLWLDHLRARRKQRQLSGPGG